MAANAFYAVPDAMQGAHRRTAAELEEPFLEALRAGDVVMVKGSNAMRMGALVATSAQPVRRAAANLQ